MDRFERHGYYARAWATGEVNKKARPEAWVAEAFGVQAFNSVEIKPFMTVDELDAELRRVGVLPAEDERDGDAEDRDTRQLVDAQARLAKLIAAGGAVDPGGVSLLGAAADEIERLRAHVEVQAKELEHDGKMAQRFRGELRQAKEALELTRSKVDELLATIGDTRTCLLARPEDPTPVAARRAIAAAEERGAAEMRERAAAWCDGEAKGKEKREQHLEASALWHAYQEIRALPLSPEPQAQPMQRDPDANTLIAGDHASAAWRASSPAPCSAGLSAEDAETLRGVGWREEPDGRWRSPIGAVFDPSRPHGLLLLQGLARDIRSKAPPAADMGPPGKGSGGEENAASGKDSVPEVRGEKQGLPKPPRVEVGQRWRFDARDTDGGMTDSTVDLTSDTHARLAGDDDRVRHRSTAELLTSLRWTFLGPAPAPQDPKRDGDPEEPRDAAAARDYMLSEPGARHPEKTQVLHSESAGVRLAMPKDADPRAVLVTVAELLGLDVGTKPESEPDLARLISDGTPEQIEAAAMRLVLARKVGAGWIRGFAAGLREGERRAKAKAAELAQQWEAQRLKSLANMEAQSDDWRQFMLGSVNSMALHALQVRKEFGLPRAPTDPGQPPAGPAPDREQLGRDVHEVARARAIEDGLDGCAWESLDERDRETARRIGERLFNMGARFARESVLLARSEAFGEGWRHGARVGHPDHPRSAAPRLYPITPAVAELAHRIESVIVEAFSQPSDGERRGPGVAREVLRLVDEHLRVTAEATTQKPAAVAIGQRWTCVGVEGELVVREIVTFTGRDPDIGLSPDGSYPSTVHGREADMLGLAEWSFLSPPA